MKKILIVFLLSFSSLFAFEHISQANFEQKTANKNVIIDFYATW